jgi:23S rRNA pseudouridine1911/1915/1917 synthase
MGPNSGYVYRERVAPASRGCTLLEHLARTYSHSVEAEWRRRIEAGEVCLDGRTAGADSRLEAGQLLTWSRPPWNEPDAPITWTIVHEDDHLLAVAKPAGLPTLPGAGFLENTLLARVRARDAAAVPVHRLGRWTSGLVLFARTRAMRSNLARAWRSRGIYKEYRALCAGTPSWEDLRVDAAIGPVPHPPLGTVHAADPSGRPALSRFTVLERRDGSFLAEVVIETGRPHQIRIHAAAAGHPLLGDPLYGKGGRPAPGSTALPGDPGYSLHARRLRLRHPETGSELDLVSEPPAGLEGAGVNVGVSVGQDTAARGATLSGEARTDPSRPA